MAWIAAAGEGLSLLMQYMNSQKKGAGGGDYNQSIEDAMKNYYQSATLGRKDVQDYYGQGLSYIAPYMGAGYKALGDYQATLGEGGVPGTPQQAPVGAGTARQGVINKFQQSPGYQFALKQGVDTINQNAASRGLTGGGATLKALTRYGEGMADQQYGAYQNRLSNLAKQGQLASSQAYTGALGTGRFLANLGQRYSEDEAGALTAHGAAQQNQSMFGQLLGGNMMNQLMKFLSMFGKGSSGAGSSGAGSSGSGTSDDEIDN